ncbi:MAG: hypothetical protein WBP42_02150 [Candidatus Zixiibacteriota bacterium]
MKIFYQVSRTRLRQGAIPSKAFLRSALNYRHAASDNCACSRCEALDRFLFQSAASKHNSNHPSLALNGAIRSVQKQNFPSGIYSRMSQFGEHLLSMVVFHFFKFTGIPLAGCKILKQLADRFRYTSEFYNSEVVGQTLIANNQRLSIAELELSESEAKFFLDTNSGTKNIDRKIFGDYSERAKFHLQRLGNLLNWRSYVLGWEGVSSYAQESARLRKAASPKQGLSTRTNYQHLTSGMKRLLGFFFSPADMEESDLFYESEATERGRKGAWSYCVIS